MVASSPCPLVAEAGEGWPEADVGGRRWWRPPPVLWSWPPCTRGWAAKSGYIAILIGDIFG